MARENNSLVVRVHKTTDFTIMSNHWFGISRTVYQKARGKAS